MGVFTKEKSKVDLNIDRYLKLRSERINQPMEIKNFKVGQIYKMSPGYYTKNSYYVEILLVTEFFIVTNIPQAHGHIFDIRDQGTWNVQTPRMTFVGYVNNPVEYNLLLNQKLD